MDSVFTLSNLALVAGLITMIVGMVLSVKKPQSDIEKTQAVAQKEVDGKAALLSQQLQWDKEANERRFKEMGESIVTSMTLAQNHIHTVDTKVDGLAALINTLTNNVTKLETIINERMPAKRD